MRSLRRKDNRGALMAWILGLAAAWFLVAVFCPSPSSPYAYPGAPCQTSPGFLPSAGFERTSTVGMQTQTSLSGGLVNQNYQGTVYGGSTYRDDYRSFVQTLSDPIRRPDLKGSYEHYQQSYVNHRWSR